MSVPALIIDAASRVIRGKGAFLEMCVAGLLAGGHILLEDLPGLGKTTVAKTLARLIGADSDSHLTFKRIQFTSDLLPYDITGVDVFDPQERNFRFVPGPVFANIVLADEINRAAAKTQSALLEVMAEKQVTIGTASYTLPEPFFVLATENPIESEGTFPLPAAQLDRFMLRLSLGYPVRDVEIDILNDNPAANTLPVLQPVVSREDFLTAQQEARSVFCHDALKAAIVDIVQATRVHPALRLGASPRAALHFLAVVRAYAFVKGRDYVTDEDICALGPAVLAHRLTLSVVRDGSNGALTPEAIAAEICRTITSAVKTL
ncbi:MAG: MoxR family ATPase [Spirochaetaceae bacterium]|nr:MoxR family ATPase [Spirochaetaceae bacterium]